MGEKLKIFFKNNWPLILILVLAVFLRFYKLGSLPPGLHPDEAANGQDVIRMLENHDFRAVYDTNGPREALFFYSQGIFVWLGKLTKWTWLNFTPLSLRIAPAIIGVFTVWAMYLLGKEFFSKNVGLLSAAALAVSAWHIQFSRNGFRAIMAPLALIFLFYFFIRAYRNGKLFDFIGLGVTTALGFYTYLSFRMVPLIVIALVGYIFFTNRDFFKKNAKNLGLMFAAFFVFMIPMFVHFFFVPADILGRASTSIFNKELNGGSPILALLSNLWKTILMFNVSGDVNWRHNVAGMPMLDILSGILFWIGTVIMFIKVKKIEYFTLLMWAGAMTAPMILTAEGIPHALRIVGIIPVVYLLVGVGGEWLFEKSNAKYAQTFALSSILLLSGGFNYYKYFVKFPMAGAAGDAYAEDMVSVANDINSGSKNRQNVLVIGEYGSKTIDFITHATGNGWQRYETSQIKDIKLSDNYKVYVQWDWITEAQKEFAKKGEKLNFRPVNSSIDGRELYYEAER